MKATGIVISANGKIATVKSTRSSACASCHNCQAKENCHIELIFGEQKQDVTVDAYNRIGAKAGNKVVLETSTDKTLFASAITFIIPIILAVISYIISYDYVSTGISAIITMSVLFVSFFALSKLMNIYAKHFLKPIVIEILEESE